MGELAMEIRSIQAEQRTVTGLVAPAGETSYLVPDPAGERLVVGAFTKSLHGRQGKVPLLRNHDRSRRLGVSRRFEETAAGLVGTFTINRGAAGDELLAELTDGYLTGMSAGFVPVVATRGADGAREIREARLVECSVVGIAAYERAEVLALRFAQYALPPMPDVNLEPIPRFTR